MRPHDRHARADATPLPLPGPAGRLPGPAGRLAGPADREPRQPAPHTAAELAALTGLLTAPRPPIASVVVGHSRDAASAESATVFAAEWEARGGTVLAVVDWPETAASWLRAARRMTAQTPDAWVIAAAVPGFVRLAQRLRHGTAWEPSRTYAFGSLCDPRVPALTGPGVLDGLRGASADGGWWEVGDGRITRFPGRTSE